MTASELESVRRPQSYEPCEECGAPMDPQQRYCVNCAARRGNGANPSSRYFAMMSKRSRRPLTEPATKQSQTSRAAAVSFFALLPIAVALGVMVGGSGSGSDNSDALLQALRERQATAGSLAPTATATTKKAGKTASPKTKKAEAAAEKKSVVAQTKNGTVHSVTNFHASQEKEAEDTELVEENPEQTGENYIKAQQHLPDVTVVGGDGSTSPAPAGSEP
jgi:hypothetical protein